MNKETCTKLMCRLYMAIVAQLLIWYPEWIVTRICGVISVVGFIAATEALIEARKIIESILNASGIR